MRKLSQQQREELLKAARAAARNSYSPYSHFRVGAAILAGRTVHLGTNVENASYGLTLCAERSAFAALVSSGSKEKIRAIAITCIDAKKGAPDELMPCGACRQWIMELAPEAEVIVDRIPRSFTARDLLPKAFRLKAG